MKVVTKITALLLALLTAFSLASCGDANYEPVPSSAEENMVVLVFDDGTERYELRYELYRALFLNYKSAVDGGDATVWSGDDKNTYIDRINTLIIDRAARIFATFTESKKIGFDPYSGEVDSEIRKLVKLAVEGGEYGGELLAGYGTYDAYLEALKKMNMNYSVQTLMYRYMLASQAIDSYYKGSGDEGFFDPNAEEGSLTYTKDDVQAFYDSDECVRILRAFLQSEYRTKAEAESLRAQMASKTTELDVALCIIQNSLTAGEEVLNGQTVGRYSLDEYYYKDFTDTAFSLPIGQVSGVVEVVSGVNDGYFIIYRAAKSDEHFEKCYDEIADVYVDNVIGKKLDATVTALKSSAEYKDQYYNVTHSGISME